MFFPTDLRDKTRQEAKEYANNKRYLKKFCDLLSFKEVLENKIPILDIEKYVMRAYEYYYCRYYDEEFNRYEKEHAFCLDDFWGYLKLRYPQYKNNMYWSDQHTGKTGTGNWKNDKEILRRLVGLDWL